MVVVMVLVVTSAHFPQPGCPTHRRTLSPQNSRIYFRTSRHPSPAPRTSPDVNITSFRPPGYLSLDFPTTAGSVPANTRSRFQVASAMSDMSGLPWCYYDL